ncbi:MAG: hypothetical protein ABR598_04475 [Candidatus Dormibacteria bacterium]
MPRRPTRPWQRPGPPGGQPARGRRAYRLDLHGYDVATACELAQQFTREAYANGYHTIELVHGARDVTEPVRAGEGRGGIKWELRRMFDHGQFDAFCRRQDSHLMEGSITLALRANPQPRSERWPTMPPKGFS